MKISLITFLPFVCCILVSSIARADHVEVMKSSDFMDAVLFRGNAEPNSEGGVKDDASAYTAMTMDKVDKNLHKSPKTMEFYHIRVLKKDGTFLKIGCPLYKSMAACALARDQMKADLPKNKSLKLSWASGVVTHAELVQPGAATPIAPADAADGSSPAR